MAIDIENPLTYSDRLKAAITKLVTFPGNTAGDTIIFQTNITDFKDSVACATTANITLSGEQTIDGVLTSASRVLVKNQTNGAQNGIYVSAAGAWSRATDADASDEVTPGLLVFCEGGTTNGNKLFTLTNTGTITLGTTVLVFDSIVLPSNPAVLKSVTGTSYTLLVTDPNKWLDCTNSSTVTITVPGNTVKIPVGSEIWVRKSGTGNIAFTTSGGGSITSNDGTTLYTRYGVARLKKTSTNGWALLIQQNPSESICVAASDETTALTTGTAKTTFRMPYAFTVTDVRASLTTAQTSGSVLTVDVNEAGTTIISTKLTFDNTEKTTTTAVTPPVISDSSIADDAEITVDIDQVGDGTAKGLKVMLIGRRT